MSCKHYTEVTLGWILNNKMIVFLGLLSFCLFVSTLALAGQRNRYKAEVEELKSQLEPATTVVEEETTTVVPPAQQPEGSNNRKEEEVSLLDKDSEAKTNTEAKSASLLKDDFLVEDETDEGDQQISLLNLKDSKLIQVLNA